MSDTADRYRKVAAGFTQRVRNVPEGRWDDPAPPEGWVARDVVRHLVEWIPGYLFPKAGQEPPAVPSVDDDPVAAWETVDAAVQGLLDDPEVTARETDTQLGRKTVGELADMIVTGDVLVHTWDLARATGQDETLDPDEVHTMFAGMEPMDEMLRVGGQYGPRVPVPDDADEQAKLIAFTGRHP